MSTLVLFLPLDDIHTPRSQPLNDWEYLEPFTKVPEIVQRLHNSCFALGKSYILSYIFKHLAVVMEMAAEFVEAHESVVIDELLGDSSGTGNHMKIKTSKALQDENNKQLLEVKKTLKDLLPTWPEVAPTALMGNDQIVVFDEQQIADSDPGAFQDLDLSNPYSVKSRLNSHGAPLIVLISHISLFSCSQRWLHESNVF